MRNKLKKIKKELQEETEEVYGEESVSGSMPSPESDDSTEDNIEDVTGNAPKRPFDIADEVAKDEERQ